MLVYYPNAFAQGFSLMPRFYKWLLFVGSLGLLALFSWDRLLGPSPHFHFLDLANSFLQGRLDTDTPKRFKGQRERPEDPKGLQRAVDRHLTGPDGTSVGWNDWASIHIITLNDGTVVKGVYPWSDSQSDQKYRFRTLDGTEMVIHPDHDIKRGCGSPGRLCDDTKYFVSFPPFPAIVFLPFFLLFGYDTNDVLFTVVNAALNALFLFCFLQSLSLRGLSSRTPKENLFLSVLFTFGTVNFFSSIRGEVWFTALIMGVTLQTLYIWAATDARHPFLAGLALALGMATRTPIAFGSVFFGMELFRDGNRYVWRGFSYLAKKGLAFSAPVLAVGALLALYNYARFENPFEFGHTFLAGGTRPSIREHGLFSFWFLKANLASAVTNPPVFDAFPPFIHITRHGLSLLFTSPFLLYLLWPKTFPPYARNLALAAFFVALPNLFYQNTGWAQFGWRFALDFMPFLFAMLAVGSRRFTKGFLVLCIYAFLMNALGAITFDRFPQFYYD
jgi:hypothetical protein